MRIAVQQRGGDGEEAGLGEGVAGGVLGPGAAGGGLRLGGAARSGERPDWRVAPSSVRAGRAWWKRSTSASSGSAASSSSTRRCRASWLGQSGALSTKPTISAAEPAPPRCVSRIQVTRRASSGSACAAWAEASLQRPACALASAARPASRPFWAQAGWRGVASRAAASRRARSMGAVLPRNPRR
jgi:hypothetical protein